MNDHLTSCDGYRNFTYFLIAMLLSLFSAASFAIEEKGMATVAYGMMLSDNEKQEALDQALRKALERWIVEKNQSHYKNYEKVRPQIDEHINDYVMSYHIIDSDKDNGQYKVVIRAELNEPKIMQALLSTSKQKLNGDQKYLTFVFVAREQVGKSSRSERTASQTKQQLQEITKGRSEESASQAKSQTKTISNNKSEKNYNDEILWDVSTTNEINTAMGDVFTEADYLVIDADYLEDETGNLLSVNKFIKDYSSGNDLTSKTKKDALNGLKSMEEPVDYLAIGTLDIEEQRIDKKTGNIQIAVSITGQVLAIFKRGAAVAKVGPETAIGEGSSPMVAKNNALKKAAQQVANKLVAKLSSKNIR